MKYTEELKQGLQTAFIDRNINSNLAYQSEFVSNDYKQGKKVSVSIEQELKQCDEFCISVAFITESGITPFLQTLLELEEKNIPGRILTTDYLMFSKPKALEILSSFKNIELKMYCTDTRDDGFHTKGYIFEKDEIYRIIIGSSNMTSNAITRNKEWNTKIIGTKEGAIIKNILDEFENLWKDEHSKSFDEFFDLYQTKYNIISEQRRIAKQNPIIDFEQYTLKPNKMQTAFIDNLKKMYNNGVEKGLLISATGTGKTYASAFAMRELGFKRVLFLVHRSQIAKQALKSFQKVFEKSVSMGLVSGKYQDYEKDYVFATIQTISKEENLKRYIPEHFDAIIYDEAHHTSAESYKRTMEYFSPKFSLGMTATPDKKDDNIDGRNIYDIFEHQIAYEIRLQQAMEEDLLCPFHYFGITDLEMVKDCEKTKEEKLENFRYLTCDERVKYVMEKAKFFGYSGDRVKGIIFCSRLDEANALSMKFNERGWRTVVLSGEDSESTRANAIERLVMDEKTTNEEADKELNEGPLDYILSVDIFSEGVDVPEINQVIMLRPTESPIVFTQQLGRGLRKAEGKEYVVILDFIGNYKNNFMIPIALSGDRSYNKDNIRRYIVEGGRIIPGASTIHFDEISRKRIFQSIDNANFSDIKLIKENYINLKNKLGRIPKLMDFDKYGEMDVLRIFDNPSLGSYYKFLVKYEKDYTVRLSEEEEKVIEFVSKKLANGKRVHELELLSRMLTHHHNLMKDLQEILQKKYGVAMNKNCAENVVNMMTNEFSSGSAKKTYMNCIFMEKEKGSVNGVVGEDVDYQISYTIEKMLKNPDFHYILQELITFGISRYEENYREYYQDTNLVLYQKYTYEDACRLLNWQYNEIPLNIGGYKYDKRTKTFPVFINYDKKDNISDTTKYEDYFLSPEELIAISKSGRTKESDDVQKFLHAEEYGIKVELFVRKNKDDKISKEFYYLGRMKATGNIREFIMSNTNKTAVEIEWKLDTPVREDIYEYIING